jgi:uncharacterized protein (TIGR01777 family)
MKILVTGSSGLIGSAAVRHLTARGHFVARLVRRNPDRSRGDIQWDPRTGRIERAALEKFDAVVHLAGEPIFGLWTAEKKRRIQRSRVQATEFLMEALVGLTHRPRVVVSASGTGFYGSRGDQWLTESSGPGVGFLATLAQEWEKATELAANAGIRVANLRIGIVLSAEGGALKAMLPAFRLGLGGPIGNGRQYMSWIALDDLTDVIGFVVENESLRGPVNAVAPTPVTNREFAKTLGAVLNRPAWFPTPAFLLRLLPGGFARETVLASQRVEPAKLKTAGFEFSYPALLSALSHCLAGTR